MCIVNCPRWKWITGLIHDAIKHVYDAIFLFPHVGFENSFQQPICSTQNGCCDRALIFRNDLLLAMTSSVHSNIGYGYCLKMKYSKILVISR